MRQIIMQMLNYFRQFWICAKGTPAVEFALYLPVLLIMLVGVTEIGYAISQSVMLEKSLRSGALYAARSTLPLSASAETAVKNVVRTGDPDGTTGYVISGWADAGATLSVTVSNYTLASDASVLGSNQLPVITITASVPYQPLLGNALTVFGLNDITLTLSHEQAHIGV